MSNRKGRTKSAAMDLPDPVEEGGGPVPSAPEHAPPTSSVTARALSLIEEMLRKGESLSNEEWAYIYTLSAHYCRHGMSVPQPLAEVLAERLCAIANALTLSDARSGLLQAVVPDNQRKAGRKKQSVSADELASDVLCLHENRGIPLRKAVRTISDRWDQTLSRAGSSSIGYSEETLLTAAKKLRAAKKSKPEGS